MSADALSLIEATQRMSCYGVLPDANDPTCCACLAQTACSLKRSGHDSLALDELQRIQRGGRVEPPAPEPVEEGRRIRL